MMTCCNPPWAIVLCFAAFVVGCGPQRVAAPVADVAAAKAIREGLVTSEAAVAGGGDAEVRLVSIARNECGVAGFGRQLDDLTTVVNRNGDGIGRRCNRDDR